MAQSVVLLLGLVLANLPFAGERLLGVWPCGERKGGWLNFAEWCLFFVVFLVLSLGVERRVQGTVHDQDWEFYVVLFFLFSVFAVPGFIWRYLWGARQRPQS